MKKTFSVKIAGPAGYGIMGAGRILGEAFSSLGFFSLVYPEYPSQIRGGDNVSLVTFSQDNILVPTEDIDILIALSLESLALHSNEVGEGGYLFTDKEIRIGEISEIGKMKGKKVIEVPLTKIAQEVVGNPLARNTIALGLIFGILELPIGALEKQIRKAFERKGKKVVSGNLQAVKKGFELADELKLKDKFKLELSKQKAKYNLLSGNDAIAQGIIDAQCGYAAIYPMTPINSILTTLAGEQKETGMIILRPEDEIAGINSAVGASFAGKRAMVATSGGGFCLMAEGFGMAGATETPLVIIEGMRAGPSSGMATWTSQEDLLFLVNISNGEFPRIVLAPGDPEEAYRLTFKAFNLADIYQLPVIVLTDKYLSESAFSGEELRNKGDMGDRDDREEEKKDWQNYRRYEDTSSGISPRALPGQTVFLTNSYVHDERGFSIDDGKTRIKMKRKLFRKLENFKESGTKLYGSSKANITFVSFGSTKQAVLAAIKNLSQSGLEVNFLHFFRPWPFPQEAKEVLRRAEKIVDVENNSTGQLAKLIRMETGITVDQKILKDDGRPFFSNEIIDQLTG